MPTERLVKELKKRDDFDIDDLNDDFIVGSESDEEKDEVLCRLRSNLRKRHRDPYDRHHDDDLDEDEVRESTFDEINEEDERRFGFLSSLSFDPSIHLTTQTPQKRARGRA